MLIRIDLFSVPLERGQTAIFLRGRFAYRVSCTNPLESHTQLFFGFFNRGQKVCGTHTERSTSGVVRRLHATLGRAKVAKKHSKSEKPKVVCSGLK
jgi:hypothetical protein